MALKIVKTLSPVFRESLGSKDLLKALKLSLNYDFDWNYITKLIENLDKTGKFDWSIIKTDNKFNWNIIKKVLETLNTIDEFNWNAFKRINADD